MKSNCDPLLEISRPVLDLERLGDEIRHDKTYTDGSYPRAESHLIDVSFDNFEKQAQLPLKQTGNSHKEKTIETSIDIKQKAPRKAMRHPLRTTDQQQSMAAYMISEAFPGSSVVFPEARRYVVVRASHNVAQAIISTQATPLATMLPKQSLGSHADDGRRAMPGLTKSQARSTDVFGQPMISSRLHGVDDSGFDDSSVDITQRKLCTTDDPRKLTVLDTELRMRPRPNFFYEEGVLVKPYQIS
jgi:hypothetical protein